MTLNDHEAMRRLSLQGRAWFSLAVAMDDNHRAEVTRRRIARATIHDLSECRAEIDCGPLRFAELTGGTYDFLAMSLTPAGPVTSYMELGRVRFNRTTQTYDHYGVTVDRGDTISIARIEINLLPAE